MIVIISLGMTMIGTTVSHYKILEKSRPELRSGFGGGIGGWTFEDLPLSGIPPYGGILSSGTALLLREAKS